LPQSVLKMLDSNTFLPSVLGSPFMTGLRYSLYISVALVIVGAVFSAMKGKKYIYEEVIKS
ncbi:MAG: MFS transporter, partial [Nitrososphaeria archaeon]